MIVSSRCDKYCFLILSFSVIPLSILAPVTMWVPGLACGLIMFLMDKEKKKFLKKISFGEYIFFLLLFFAFISSFWSIGKDFAFKNSYEILLIFIVYRVLYIKSQQLQNKEYFVKVFFYSLVSSCVILTIDFIFSLGIKPWLSVCFEQIINKELQPSYFEFKKGYVDGSYVGSYSRGLATICIFSFLVFLMRSKSKVINILFFIIILFCIFLGDNYTVKISLLFSLIITTLIYYFRRYVFKFLVIFFGLYHLSAPWIFSLLDYNNLNKYRTKTVLQHAQVNKKINNYTLENTLVSYSNYILLKTKYAYFHSIGKIYHRLHIWNFTSQKIFENLLFGKGIFSSRKIGETEKVNVKIFEPQMTDYNELVIYEKDSYLAAIPLHPHNNTLQLWMELGFFGVIIFLILFYIIWSKIIYSKNINNFQKSILSGIFINVFMINQSSYGLWQIWWLSSILILYILSKNILEVSNDSTSKSYYYDA